MVNVRLTREDWIGAARKLLIASGVEDVKIHTMARRLKVTRGSFHHHFKHHQNLLDALLDDWAANNRREIDHIREKGADVTELFRVWLDEDPSFAAFDIAIRVWARKSRVVAKVVREIDESWIVLLREILQKAGLSAPESAVRAKIMFFHQIGFYASSIEESLSDAIEESPHYYTALTGMVPPEDLPATLLARLKPRRARAKTIA